MGWLLTNVLSSRSGKIWRCRVTRDIIEGEGQVESEVMDGRTMEEVLRFHLPLAEMANHHLDAVRPSVAALRKEGK